MKYKLGLDLGSTSLGWAVVELDKDDNIVRLVDMGVRIFPDGRDAKTHAPINVKRREARSMRRRLDRVQQRKRQVVKLLKKYGLEFDITSDSTLANPYELRARGLTEKLTRPELGRVMLHFALRRGFKSNRKELRGTEGGKLKAATASLRNALGDGTLAQFQVATGKYRFSNQFDGTSIKDGALYPTRDMYLDEFQRLCKAQHMPDEMHQDFETAIFYQRPLRAPERGNCLFEPGEYRAYKYEPDFQRWRALQQINQLSLVEHGKAIPLSDEQRQKIMDMVFVPSGSVKKGKLTFAEIKKQLGLSRAAKFNLETEKRKDIDADKTAFAFYEVGELDFYLRLENKQELLDKINDDSLEDAELLDFIVNKLDATPQQAEKIIQVSLEDDVANVSLVAIRKMLPFLEQGQMFHDAARSAGYHHSAFVIPTLEALPYYGDLAILKPSLAQISDGSYRTMNATVHIAMNQIRAVVNELIQRFGRPYAINVEMGRDLRSGAEDLKKIDKLQSENKKKNDKIAAELASIGILNPSREDFQKYKLWEALAKEPQKRRCVYTGQPITSIIELFKSGKFEIEHILPYAQTLDDSMANKTISAVEANRFKGNRTPYEAFSDSKSPWDYEGVWERAQSLPDASRWRFKQDALTAYLRGNDCIARALNDTRFMSKMAVDYLRHICSDKNKVLGLPGQMTALFRDMWHLDWWKNKEDSDKYRSSHVHHAIDAFVIACMGAGKLQTLSKNATKLENYFGKTLKEKRKQLFVGLDIPFAGFDFYDFKIKTENMIISYRRSLKDPRDIGTIGQLHEDTAYSLESFQSGVKATMSRRIPMPIKDKDFENINRGTLTEFLNDTGIKNDDPDIYKKFISWAESRGIKSVRVYKEDVDTTSYIPIFRTKAERDACHRAYIDWYVADGLAVGMSDKKQKQAQALREEYLLQAYRTAASRAYKWYVGGNNFCAEIFEIRSDDKRYPKLRGKWMTEVVSNYNAELDQGIPVWRQKYATARRIMSLRINDMVMAEFSKNDPNLPKGLIEAVRHQCLIDGTDTVNMVFRVKKLKSTGVVYLRPHSVAKEDADTKSWAASASSLQAHNARKVHISPTGKILK